MHRVRSQGPRTPRAALGAGPYSSRLSLAYPTSIMVLDRDFMVHAAAGTCGGVAGVYVGAPLDTIKVLLQTRSYSGMMGMEPSEID